MRGQASKDQARRERRVAHRAAAEMLKGATFRVEGCRGVFGGEGLLGPLARHGADKRWRSPENILAPGELLSLDPSHLPAGTEIGIVRPERLQMPLEFWMLYAEVGLQLLRTVKSIRNLVYKHRLANRTFWDGRGRYRKRVTMLPPATVRRLAELTGKGFLISP
jgi:hypothetical protein